MSEELNPAKSKDIILAPGNPEPELAYCDGYTAKIKWKKPSGIIHHYNVCYRYAGVEHDKVLQTKMQEITLSDLQKGSVYSLTVQSVSNENSSIQSKVIEFSTAPMDPQNLRVRLFHNNSVKVMFEDSDPREKEYEITFIGRDGPQKKTVKDHFLYYELNPGQLYEIYVRAVIHTGIQHGNCGENEVDEEGAPKSSTQIAEKQKLYSIKSPSKELWTYPAKLDSVKVIEETSKNRLTYEWQTPADKPTHYTVVVKENGVPALEDITNTEIYTIEKPKPSTTYKISVAAVNDAGSGEARESDGYVTAPEAPRKIDVVNNPSDPQTSIIVTYEDNNPLGTKYIVEALNADFEPVQSKETDKKQTVINKLSAGESYKVMVVAISIEGKMSEKSYFM